MIVSNATGIATTQSTQSTKNTALGKDDFLKLLLQQIKNQDPLNPMDNTEFTSQMAQFSSLEQLFNINDGLNNLTQYIASLNNTQALNLIGKEVVATGDNVHVKDGQASDLHFKLDQQAASVTITVMDKAGLPVRTIERGNMGTGSQTVSWDGRSDYGTPLSDGLYQYAVEARDSAGNSIGVTTFTTGIVTGINFENGVTYVQVGDQEFMISDISKINDTITTTTPTPTENASPAAGPAETGSDGVVQAATTEAGQNTQ